MKDSIPRIIVKGLSVSLPLFVCFRDFVGSPASVEGNSMTVSGYTFRFSSCVTLSMHLSLCVCMDEINSNTAIPNNLFCYHQNIILVTDNFSMIPLQPTLNPKCGKSKDIVWVDRMSLCNHGVRRGDVVAAL